MQTSAVCAGPGADWVMMGDWPGQLHTPSGRSTHAHSSVPTSHPFPRAGRAPPPDLEQPLRDRLRSWLWLYGALLLPLQPGVPPFGKSHAFCCLACSQPPGADCGSTPSGPHGVITCTHLGLLELKARALRLGMQKCRKDPGLSGCTAAANVYCSRESWALGKRHANSEKTPHALPRRSRTEPGFEL